MERRDFIKRGCQACLLIAVGTMLPSLPAMAAPKKKKPFKAVINDQHQAEVPLSLFEDGNLQIIRIKGTFYDVALHRSEENIYTAFLMKCTHMDNQLYLTSDGFRCSMHGSEYDKKGQVTKGPSEHPLITYPVSVNDTQVLINIPQNEE